MEIVFRQMTPQNDRLDLSFNLSGHLILVKIWAYEDMGAKRKLGKVGQEIETIIGHVIEYRDQFSIDPHFSVTFF